MSPGEAILPLSWPIDLELTVASHGWAHLAPWSWDPETGRLGRRERIGKQCGTIELAQSGPDSMVLRWDGFTPANLPEIQKRARRWLSADWQPSSAMAALCEDGALIAQGGGRLLRCSSFYEDFVKTVLTINTSWSSTCRMAAALVTEPGDGAFPGPEAVLDYGEERLRERAKLGFRAATVISATRRLLDDGAIDAVGRGTARTSRLRLSDQPQGHRSLCRGALPSAAARFQPPSGRFRRDRLPSGATRLRPRRVRREPVRPGVPIWRLATGSRRLRDKLASLSLP